MRVRGQLEPRELDKLERLIHRWIVDPSSFIGPDGDVRKLFSNEQY